MRIWEKMRENHKQCVKLDDHEQCVKLDRPDIELILNLINL